MLLPEDADARDVAEAAGWFIGADNVALLPGRGVRWGSGPRAAAASRRRARPRTRRARVRWPRRRLGDRARRGCAARRGAARAGPARRRQPSPGSTASSEQLALAGYERVERVEERGQFAVRGGLVDVFPTTGREPLRIELYGDEIEQVRAFSPFTQRALHPVEAAVVYPAAERRADLLEPTLERATRQASCSTSRTTSCRCSTGRPTSSGSPTRCAASGRRRGSRRSRSRARPSSTPSRRHSRSRSRRSGPRSQPAASPRPRTS